MLKMETLKGHHTMHSQTTRDPLRNSNKTGILKRFHFVTKYQMRL
jgi:hypothetical protein